MKQNYIDGKGVYHNELNFTLAQIYDSGVEFGCKVTAMDKAEDIIAELKKLKAEFEEIECVRDNPYNNEIEYSVSMEELRELLDKHIAELKGGAE